MPQSVKFKSGGIACAGDLYLPPGFTQSRNYPGLVIGHGTAQTKKSLIDQGEFFSRAGYLVLAIDYRSFGESEGEPRGQLFPLVQVEDFRNGVSFLRRTPGVDRERIGIWGTSNSGGTVIYAAAVDRRIKAVVAQVPFVDVLNTMLDASLPLTTSEYIEWGNPNEKDAYVYMKKYSPYDNIGRKNYPSMLIKVSLNDSQVPYWEGAKLVARLRAMKTDNNPLLLKTNMGAGHGGSSGRYDYLREVAFDYAYMLWQMGVAE